MGGFEREKHLKPLIAAGLMLVLLGCGWLYGSHLQRLDRFQRKIEAARTELTQLSISLREYRELEGRLQKLKPQGGAAPQRNLISTVEDATEQIAARSQLIYVRPQADKTREDLIEEGVEIKLEKLQLHQLVELLYRFEQNAQMLRVAQLRVRTRFDNPEQLDTSITLSRFREKR